MSGRVPFIAGNWKMNPETVEQALELAKSVASLKSTNQAQVALFVPHPFIAAVRPILEGAGIDVGAQSCFAEQRGAYTGATSTSMIKSVGGKHVLVGHSERRSVFKYTDEMINGMVHKALKDGLSPILCIGETKEEYESKLNKQICAVHLSKGLKGVTKEQMRRVTIAYEPVWAIGTGLVCDPDTAQDVHAFVRSWLTTMFDAETAAAVRIQYGGSVTPDSVDDLMAKPDIDGCLVGGASLDPAKFARIIAYVPK